jgi:hypothetical protein
LSYVLGQKQGGGVDGHTKKAGWWLDPKFDDYTQNSSEKQAQYRIKTCPMGHFNHCHLLAEPAPQTAVLV